MNGAALSPVARHLARFLGRGDADAELAAALACEATQAGHVCADLDQEAGWGPGAAALDAAGRAAFRARLPELAIVCEAADEDGWTPLVWDGRRLYLRRYRDYERQVADDLLARAAPVGPLDAATATRLDALFADAGQRAAARVALTRRLCLISGGPGTGKTHTLARIIGLLRAQDGKARIALAAPTGKAAARMGEALQAAGTAIDQEGGGAQTLHRLLGMRADGSGFHRNRERPLAVDALVVDEASMIDLSLMAHLLAALPPTACLILLGDRDQLAAVEAGAVFADLCASPRLADCVAQLTTSFRFGGAGGIGRLAGCLRAGEADGAIDLLRGGGEDLEWQPPGDLRELVAAVRAGYRPYLDAVAAGGPAAELFGAFNRFRALCAHRQEVAAINRALAGGDALRPAPGLPVMVVRNDPLLRLYNGDIGLVLPDPADGALRVCFAGERGLRWVALARLPAWEPAWAMTVHKSQGSEFDEVLLAMPAAVAAASSSIATRELVYTGVTRARRRVVLRGGEDVLRAVIASRTERMSGLRDRLQ